MEYALWADGDYHSFEDDPEPPSWKSDDYVIIDTSDEDIDDIDEFMSQKHLEVNLGHSTNSKTITG